MIYHVYFTEKNNDRELHTTFTLNDNTIEDVFDVPAEDYLADFFGLNEGDVTSYRIEIENNDTPKDIEDDNEDITFDTIHVTIVCKPRFDAETNESYYEMYDTNDGYYGELHTDDISMLTASDIEDQIEENLYN